MNTDYNYTFAISSHALGNIYCTNLHRLSIHTLQVTWSCYYIFLLMECFGIGIKMIELVGYGKVIVCVCAGSTATGQGVPVGWLLLGLIWI